MGFIPERRKNYRGKGKEVYWYQTIPELPEYKVPIQ
jgi:hypothetical protein